MEDQEDISIDLVEEKFSVLYLSLRTAGVQSYLGIDVKAEPKDAKVPVLKAKLPKLVNYARWLFGTEDTPPLFSDSRKVEQFGEILENDDAVAYLERSEKPTFDYAYQIAGGGEKETINLLAEAADNLQLALAKVHLHKKAKKLPAVVERLGRGAVALLAMFPAIQKIVLEDQE
jgi:hypothetical protein